MPGFRQPLLSLLVISGGRDGGNAGHLRSVLVCSELSLYGLLVLACRH